jgi:predicted HicB family RNase H-like nuclease
MSDQRQMVHVRLPADLHAALLQQAEKQGVSLNQLLVALLAGAVGFSLKKTRKRPAGQIQG